MFIVKCMVSGTLSFDLEEGAITLAHGRNFDLEEHCSRRWIKKDEIIQRFIKEGKLIVVFDSLETIPGHPIGDAVTPTSARAAKKSEPSETIIVDFSDVPDPDDLEKLDDFVEGKVLEEDLDFVAPVKEEPKPEKEEPAAEEDGKALDPEKVKSLSWTDLRKLAKDMGVKTYRKSKEDLIEELCPEG